MSVIETERLILRQLTPADLPALHAILSDPITMRFWPTPFSAEASQSWIERNLERYASDGFGRWAVINKTSQVLIGDCGIVRTEINGQPEHDLGYIFGHAHWGQGYATEAARACQTYGHTRLNLPRLVANMAVDHTASRRVAERLGMRLETHFHNSRNRNLLTCLYVSERGSD